MRPGAPGQTPGAAQPGDPGQEPSTPAESLLGPDVPIDLDNCAREPIHIPGSIQPRGVLLAVRELTLTVTQVSANLSTLTGIEASRALRQPLSRVLGPRMASAIERAVAVFGDLQQRNPIDVVVQVDGQPVAFDAILHRAPDGVLLIELEVANGPRPFSFPNTYLAVRGAVAELNQAASLTELYDITARAVRELTGFDRVMVYRYDQEFNGEVVAENKRPDLETFLGLHYPASDIPAQARSLYEQNWIRLISDVDYQPAPIIPNLDPETGAPLDLTGASLRSVSPIHIQYLKNMGVRASMSISLLRHGVLWGLIACHHYSGPHTPPYGVRTAAEFLGSALSLRLVSRADEDDLRDAVRAQSVLTRLTAGTQDESQPMVSALLGVPSVLDLFPAGGVAVFAEGRRGISGKVPDPDTVHAIAQWARTQGEDLVATDSLAASAPHLQVSPAVASGVLALQLPDDQYVLWFRAEARLAVDWAGDPRHQKTEGEGSSGPLTPRTSFERWREVVRQRSEPWEPEERLLALELRTHTVEALYTRSQRGLRLAEILQRSLLPPSLPRVAHWTLTAHYETAEGGQVGGDWYDALTINERTLTVVLGDVAGHGMATAGIMAQLRNALRAYLLETPSPGEALERLNQFTNRLLPSAFATAAVACIDSRTGLVRAANAGHPTPYLLGPGREVVPADLPPAPPLGVPGARYPVSEFSIPPGGGLILFSDGLVERRREHLDVGFARLASALGRLGPHPSADEVFTAAGQSGAHDDATVLAVHRGLAVHRRLTV